MTLKTQFACYTAVASILLAWCLIELPPVSGQDAELSDDSKPVKTPAKPGVEPDSSEDFGYGDASREEKTRKKKYFYSYQGGNRNRRGSRKSSAQSMIQQATKKYKAAKTDEEKAAAQKEMSAALSGFFDEDMKNREAGIVKIEERVKKLRAQLEKRRDAKDRLVDLQVQLLVNEANGLGFYSQPGSKSSRYSWYGTFNNSQQPPAAYGTPGAEPQNNSTPRWSYYPDDNRYPKSNSPEVPGGDPLNAPRNRRPETPKPSQPLGRPAATPPIGLPEPTQVPAVPSGRTGRRIDPSRSRIYENNEVSSTQKRHVPCVVCFSVNSVAKHFFHWHRGLREHRDNSDG